MSAVRPRVATAAAIAFALTAGYLAQGTYAAGTPANKVSGSGSTIERLKAGADQAIPLLTETVKINNPTDLIIGVTAECALETKVTNSADGELSEAFGQIRIYVTIDDIEVPITDTTPGATGATDDGHVVFCNRAQGQVWTNSPDSTDDDENDSLTQYQNTKTANAFNWLALNIGTQYPGIDGDSNIHEIKVMGEWTVAETGDAVAEAYVGNRTLVLEPVKAAHGELVEVSG